MRNFIKKLALFTRWSDWGPGKIPVLCMIAYYIGLTYGDLSTAFAIDVVLFVIYASLHSALGYVINNWGDRELDARHGKYNAFNQMTNVQGIAALGTLLFLAFLSGLPFVGRPWVLPLWIGWAFVAFSYSLKPLRLKERGTWGIAFAFLSQWFFSVALVFAAFNHFGGWDMIIFVVATTIGGATLIIGHQRWDRARDLSTGTGTLATRKSASQIDKMYAIVLGLDKIAVGAVIIQIAVGLTASIYDGSNMLAIPLVVMYGLLLAFSLYETYRASRQNVVLDSFYSKNFSRTASKLLHETLLNLIVPTYLILMATLYEPINGVILLLFLFWRLVLGQANWMWPLKALLRKS